METQQLKNIYHYVSALCAAIFYRFPGKKIKVIGVTGTDGKTTTVHLIHHILKSAGMKVSMVSSVYAEIGSKQYDTGFHVTTPDCWMVQKLLKQAVETGDEFMVLEVTSHGLDQNRVSFIDFEIGVLTNVTHEHLDYHQAYENYLNAKAKLLARAKKAIINRDDESYEYLIKDTRLQKDDALLVTYGIKNPADINPEKFAFTSPLPGEFNRYNCLAAIAAAKQLGVDDASIQKALKSATGVKGRFERIQTKFGFDVIIDFAHTPNSFKQVLPTIKSETKGKLIHVFGCASERDTAKRPIMGEISAQYADLIILTEEDYRTESIDKIMNEIAQGCIKGGAVEKKGEKKTIFVRLPNRQDAINFAVSNATKGDMVLLTGKAHEKSLCRKTHEYPWSEHNALKKALRLRE